MSTFGGLRTAYSGLAAARAAIDVTGQNIANATTAGYTRQRVTQEAVGATGAGASIFVTGTGVGTGVNVTGIQRIDDQMVDQRLRSATASNSYWTVASGAMDTVEASLGEPSGTGLSATLGDFWASWQNLSNNPTLPSAGQTVLSTAHQLASQISSGYQTADANWSNARSAAADTVARINEAAGQVAQLNTAILVTTAGGGTANELIDQRSTLLTSLSSMTGATVRTNSDNTVDVVVGGYTMVSSTTSRQLVLAGASTLAAAAGSPVHVEWADKAGVAVEIDGGSLAGSLTALAPASAGGSGGPFAEAAALYNTLATTLATKVNAAHSAGATAAGTTGLVFFSFAAGGPAATGLTVVPTGLSSIATAAVGSGAANGTVADAIGKIGDAADGPDRVWSGFVVAVGAQTRNATTQATLTGATLTTATTAQSSQNAVDLDEETTNLITFQHAYQGAARMMTAIDEMLDVLINRTGLVGR